MACAARRDGAKRGSSRRVGQSLGAPPSSAWRLRGLVSRQRVALLAHDPWASSIFCSVKRRQERWTCAAEASGARIPGIPGTRRVSSPMLLADATPKGNAPLGVGEPIVFALCALACTAQLCAHLALREPPSAAACPHRTALKRESKVKRLRERDIVGATSVVSLRVARTCSIVWRP